MVRRAPSGRERRSSWGHPAARAVAFAIASTLTLALLVAGCGSGGDDSTETTVAEPPASSTPSEPSPDAPSESSGQKPAVGDGRGGVRLARVGSFSAPVFVAQPPAERDVIYVVEQGGRIIRVDGDGATSTLLDLSGEISSGGERGLLSLAFAPDFERSGLLYVDYTDPDGNTRVVEYRSRDGRTVDADSRRELLRIDQPFSNHNGGLLLFGPDELLYIGTGDGGSADDPMRNAQDRSNLLGKILRIDPKPSGGRPYTIPADNPFTGSGDARGEIYSYGLRNPWRFSFDRDGGALAIGDVGQNSREEVDLVDRSESAGANFGWSAFEGEERFNSDQEAPDAIPPVLTYATSGGNCSVTGGYVVRDRALTSLYGRYLYGDFCLGQLRSFSSNPGKEADDDRELGLEVSNLSSFGEDSSGQIYATSLDGDVYRLEPEQ